MTQKNVDEFTAYVQARSEHWRRAAYLLSRNWHTADDIVSIMVGKLFRRWPRISAVENVDAYAQRMLTRVWLDETRRPWRREQPTQDVPERTQADGHDVEERDALWQMLGDLGPRQRAVLVLRYYLDMTVEQVADVLGVAPGTVMSQSARALERLRGQAASERGQK